MGCNLHLQLPSKYTVGIFGCVWISRPAKPRLLTQKPSQKGCLRNRETAWSGSSMTPFFDLCWGDLQCQTLRPEPIKKTRLPKTQPSKQRNSMAWRTQEARFLTCAHCAPRFGLEMHRLHLRLRLGITTGKTTTSDPKAFPKRLPPEQGNSMAWRTQGHRFSTCVG